MSARPVHVYASLRCAGDALTCRVEVGLAVDGAVSAAAGTPSWATAAGEGWYRIITAVLTVRCQEFLDSLVDVGGYWAVKKFAALGLRSGPAVVWHPVHLLLGHAAAAVRAP